MSLGFYAVRPSTKGFHSSLLMADKLCREADANLVEFVGNLGPEEIYQLKQSVLRSQEMKPVRGTTKHKLNTQIVEAVLKPTAAIITKLYEPLHFEFPGKVFLNGYTKYPGIVGMCNNKPSVIVVTRSAEAQIGKGSADYFSGIASDAAHHFMSAFDEALQSCMLAQTDRIILSDGFDYVFMQLSNEFYVEGETRFVKLEHYDKVNITDSVTTVRTCAFLLMALESRYPFPTCDFFRLCRKTQCELNEDRRASIKDLANRIPTAFYELPDFEYIEANLGDGYLQDVTICEHSNCQVLKISTRVLPQEYQFCDKAMIQIYDPYYYHNVIHTEEEMFLSAQTWFEKELSIYAALKDLQGECIPQLYGYGYIMDIWDDNSPRPLYSGFFILLEDLGCERPLKESSRHYQLAHSALSSLHNSGIQHSNLDLDKMLLHDGRVYIFQFDQAKWKGEGLDSLAAILGTGHD
ncbi:hypothetical protein TRVA0_029S00738 [Trichomonascus vanleenenianus]|uniref:uncharacterized protein n=1 Tax=Trichomonascus vanleenenianus TaxID=2268995 RepID=UPI003ECB9996